MFELFAEQALNSFFKLFYTACPNSVLEFQQLDSRLFEKLTDGRLDAAILPETIKLPVKFHFQRLSLLKYCLIVGKNHPLERYYNKYKELPISEIEKYRKITITNQLSHENAFYLLDERILTGEAHQETGLALPFSSIIPSIVIQTDLTALLPEKNGSHP